MVCMDVYYLINYINFLYLFLKNIINFKIIIKKIHKNIYLYQLKIDR